MRCTSWHQANEIATTRTTSSLIKYVHLKKNFHISLSDTSVTTWMPKIPSSSTIALSCRATPLEPIKLFFTAKYNTPYGGRRHWIKESSQLQLPNVDNGTHISNYFCICIEYCTCQICIRSLKLSLEKKEMPKILRVIHHDYYFRELILLIYHYFYNIDGFMIRWDVDASWIPGHYIKVNICNIIKLKLS